MEVRTIGVELRVGLGCRQAKTLAIAVIERALVEAYLERNRGNIAAATRDARMDRSNFRRLMRRHGITADAYRIPGDLPVIGRHGHVYGGR